MNHIFQTTIFLVTIFGSFSTIFGSDMNFAFFWRKENVSTTAEALFKRLILPNIHTTCNTPSQKAAIDGTIFNFLTINLNHFLNFESVSASMDMLVSRKVMFAGSLDEPIVTLFDEGTIPSTETGKNMVVHYIGPLILSQAIPGIELVVNHFIPSNNKAENEQAIFVLGVDIAFHNFGNLLTRFTHGVYYYPLVKGQEKIVASKIKQLTIKNIILAADSETASDFLTECYKAQLVNYEYRWFIYKSRLVDSSKPAFKIVSKNITSMEFGPVATVLEKQLMDDEQILLYDLMSMWEKYLTNKFCGKGFSSDLEVHNGLTGDFTMNKTSGNIARTSWNLLIYRGIGSERERVGWWNNKGNFSITPQPVVDLSEQAIVRKVKKNKFRIVTIYNAPFVQFKQGKENVTDEPLHLRLEGYAIDTCIKLLQDKNITDYEFFFQDESSPGYGQLEYNAQGESYWVGLISTLVNGSAELACASLTPTPQRRGVVDFTENFLTYQYSVIYKKQVGDPLRIMFEFMNPFHSIVWASVAGTIVFMAIMLSFLHFLSPNKTPFDIYNSLFFSLASFLQGITGTPPDRLSGRIVVASYWLFVMVILIVYVTNYAAIRTLHRLQSEIETIDNLLKQSTYEYGITKNTNLVELFRNSSKSYMQEIYKKMSEDFTNGLVDNYTHAINLVDKGNFAYISDNARNKYFANTRCNLIISAQFEQGGVALATPKNVEYKDVLSNAVLQLHKTTFFTDLEKKYFERTSIQKPDCTDYRMPYVLNSYIPLETGIFTSKKGALTLRDTLGIAVINVVGCLLTILVAFIECLCSFCGKKIKARRNQKALLKTVDQRRHDAKLRQT